MGTFLQNKNRSKIFSMVVLAIFLVQCILPVGNLKVYAKPLDQGKKVTIISFSDFHGTVDNSASSKNPGMSKFASVIKGYTSQEDENNGYLVLSAGDNYQGSAMSNLNYGSVISEMMKELGVTASALGNHEFDWGIDKIPQWQKDGNFKFLASNIYDKTTGKPVSFAEPYITVEKCGMKIGVIGITTQETLYKTTPTNVGNFEFKDPAEAANKWADYLRNTEKVDAVVALSHVGGIQDSKTGKITGEVAQFAEKAKGIDAIIGGHTHSVLCGIVNNIPIVQGYYNGRAISQLTFTMEDDKLKVVPNVRNLVSEIKNLKEDSTVKAIYDSYSENMAPLLNEKIATLNNDLDHERFEGLSTLGEFTGKLLKKVTGTQIAIINGGGIRSPLYKGDITMGDMYTVFSFDNTLVTMEMSGEQLKKNFEHGINPTNDVGYIQYYGVKVYFDSKREPGNMITSMRLIKDDGSVGDKIEMDKYYTIVINDFLAENGDGYDFCTNVKNKKDTNIVLRDSIVDELKKFKVVSYTRENLLVDGNDPLDSSTPIPEKQPSEGNTNNEEEVPAKQGESNLEELPQAGKLFGASGMVATGTMSIVVGAVLLTIIKKNNHVA